MDEDDDEDDPQDNPDYDPDNDPDKITLMMTTAMKLMKLRPRVKLMKLQVWMEKSQE